MHPDFNPARILRTTDDNELGNYVLGFAAEFSVLGYFAIARELISLVNKHASLYRRNTHIFQPFWLLWDMTGTWPEGEEAYVQASADSGDRESNQLKREAVAELAERYEMISWTNAGFQERGEQMYDETRLRGCLKKLREFTASEVEGIGHVTTGWMAIDESSILLKALEIAIVLEEQGSSSAGEGLPDVDEIMGWIAKRLNANHMIDFLTQSAKVWGLLKDGALAKAIGVKDEKVQKFGARVLETFKTRYEKGVQRSEMWNKSVEELAQIISHNTVNSQAARIFRAEKYVGMYGAEEEEEESEGGDKRKDFTTILKAPASCNDLAALEKRLEISLPDDYKDFLATTNGMGPSWCGIIEDTLLFPASEVRWITKEENYFTDLTADILPNIFNLLRDIYDNNEWPTVGIPLQIGSEDIEKVWLLPPTKVKDLVAMYLKQRERSAETKTFIENAISSWAGSVAEFENLEWFVVTWISGGAAEMQAYPSFKAYLVNKAGESGDEGPNPGGNPEHVCFSYSCR